MDDLSAQRDHLERLRQWRNRPGRESTLAGLADHVQRQYIRPGKQLGKLIELWTQHIPADIEPRTALSKFQRGVLTVHVADSATLYELDRLLRAGLERTIAQQSKTPLRKIRLTITHMQ